MATFACNDGLAFGKGIDDEPCRRRVAVMVFVLCVFIGRAVEAGRRRVHKMCSQERTKGKRENHADEIDKKKEERQDETRRTV